MVTPHSYATCGYAVTPRLRQIRLRHMVTPVTPRLRQIRLRRLRQTRLRHIVTPHVVTPVTPRLRQIRLRRLRQTRLRHTVTPHVVTPVTPRLRQYGYAGYAMVTPNSVTPHGYATYGTPSLASLRHPASLLASLHDVTT